MLESDELFSDLDLRKNGPHNSSRKENPSRSARGFGGDTVRLRYCCGVVLAWAEFVLD